MPRITRQHCINLGFLMAMPIDLKHVREQPKSSVILYRLKRGLGTSVQRSIIAFAYGAQRNWLARRIRGEKREEEEGYKDQSSDNAKRLGGDFRDSGEAPRWSSCDWTHRRCRVGRRAIPSRLSTQSSLRTVSFRYAKCLSQFQRLATLYESGHTLEPPNSVLGAPPDVETWGGIYSVLCSPPTLG
ncbi:hypothetical protein BX600DRAFT_523814 [Xylariales sp. PMI_506]|nr:hypothetical protein BX600DRAFT_523814 [Xylariales sp. PMI_506]